jgi:Ca2+-binding EF-hand superfamily protein
LIYDSFSIFDEDSSGTVDYKELVSGLEVFREDSIEEKIGGKISFNIFVISFL